MTRAAAVLPAIALLLAGCASTAYHHSSRFSVAVETRSTDPSQPVQGNIGAKTRTVLFAPRAGDDVASVVSDFSVARTADDDGKARTVILSAYLTGSAAQQAPAQSTAIMGGAGLAGAGSAAARAQVLSNIRRSLNDLHTRDGDRLAGEYLAAMDSRAAGLSANGPGLPRYRFNTGDLSDAGSWSTVGNPPVYTDVIRRLQDLDGAMAAVRAALDAQDATLGGNALEHADRQRLLIHLIELEQARDGLVRARVQVPEVQAAGLYVVNQL